MELQERLQVGPLTLECVKGDIADQRGIDVIVNAANAQLATGGGVAGAIHSKAGPRLAAECASLAPIRPGEAVITDAYDLPNRRIIHCLGPVYGIDRPEDKLLASCYRGALNLAETHGMTSIAFPAISTGVFSYPLQEAAWVSFNAIRDYNGYQHLQLVRFVLWSEPDWRAYCKVMRDLFKDKNSRQD